jgi:peptidyl-prolyl cis-trans isomerase C
MKSVYLLSHVIVVSLVTSVVFANDQLPDSEILAKRGNGVVSQDRFAARAAKIPAENRRATLRDGKRLETLINTLLLRAQIVADARVADYDKDPLVAERMNLAAEAELAEAWVEHYIDAQPEGDYEQLAREYYELNKHRMMSNPTIDVSHILVSSEDRNDDEAKALATSIYNEAKDHPEDFDELIASKSEDPSAISNKGKFFKVKRGDMVKAFEESAFALNNGEISEPVKTNYGFHVIRLDRHNEPVQQTFDDVKEALISRERKKHGDRIRNDYLSRLSQLNVEMTKEALEEMVRRQYGDDVIESETGSDETE